MAKVLKVVAIVAGVVALVVPGLQALGVATILGATAGSIAAIAGVVAGVASLGAGLLTKPPPARGSVTQMTIAVDAPQPYVMGEGYYAGILRYQRSYGPTLDKIPNPYRFQAVVYSGGGPVDSLTPYVDMGAIGGYYSGFLYTTTALGSVPDSALVPQWSGAPGWDSTSKLSGKAAIGWSLKFDKAGKVFASGMPQTGAYGKWVKVYDPRLDSTFAGGSGSQRLNDESTWAWSENPALHAGTYAYGRYQNSALSGGARRTIGIGLPADAIDWANVAAWANVCTSNAWTLFGVVYEPGDRWANLRDICAAGGAEPVLTAGALSFHYSAPRVALDTITEADLIQGAEQGVTAQASWRDRLNTIVPKYRDPAQNWELVQGTPVQVSTYLSDDGEVKQAEWPFNFVKSVNQAAQLSRYRLEDSRELQGIELVCGPRLRAYRPGDCLQLALLAYLGLSGPAVVLRREIDPAGLTVKLTLIGETAGKHAYALGQTSTAPPTPALGQTAAARDVIAAAAIALPPRGAWSNTTNYYEGNEVSQPDGSTYVYINTTASSGHAPPTPPTTSNTWWEQTNPPLLADGIRYTDGTPIESLQPAQIGATAGAPTGTPVGTITAADVSATVLSGGGIVSEQVTYSSVKTGGLNTITSASQSGSQSIFVSLNAPNTNGPNGDGTATVVAASVINSNNAGDAVFVDASVVVTNATARGHIEIQKSTDNATWTNFPPTTRTYLAPLAGSGVSAATYSVSALEHVGHATGTLYYRIVMVQAGSQSTGDGTAGVTQFTVTSGTIKVRKYFSK